MRLVYYRGDGLNYGDDLNADLWPAIAPGLFQTGNHDNDVLVGIGTIIGMALPGTRPRKVHVFSSGIGNDDVTKWSGLDVNFWCVRGPLSARLLKLEADRILTDGAILTPLIAGFPTRKAEGRGVLVIPHHASMEFAGWSQACRMAGFELLDPRAPPKHVIARIASAELVLTESLHGAILADLYGVPWRAFASSRHFGVAKWVDWLASLDRKLALTLIPAPDHRLVLAFGKRPEPIGSCLSFSLEDAMGEFTSRVGVDQPASFWKATLKRLAAASSIAGPVLGYTPSRTAGALQALATGEGEVTPASTVSSLQDRMLDRLRLLERRP